MKNLKLLNAHNNYVIDQNGITGLDLTELDVTGNDKITNVSFMKNLKILRACHGSGIGQNGISELDLIEIDITGNKNITDLSFMKNLKMRRVNLIQLCNLYDSLIGK